MLKIGGEKKDEKDDSCSRVLAAITKTMSLSYYQPSLFSSHFTSISIFLLFTALGVSPRGVDGDLRHGARHGE